MVRNMEHCFYSQDTVQCIGRFLVSDSYNLVKARKSIRIFLNFEESSKRVNHSLTLYSDQAWMMNPWRAMSILQDGGSEYKRSHLQREEAHTWRDFFKNKEWMLFEGLALLGDVYYPLVEQHIVNDSEDELKDFFLRHDGSTLYDTVYSLTQNHQAESEQVYELAVRKIKSFEQALSCSFDGGADSTVNADGTASSGTHTALVALAKAWSRHETFLFHHSQIFRYIERYFIPSTSLPNFFQVANGQFFRTTFLSVHGGKVLLDAMTSLDAYLVDGTVRRNLAGMVEACVDQPKWEEYLPPSLITVATEINQQNIENVDLPHLRQAQGVSCNPVQIIVVTADGAEYGMSPAAVRLCKTLCLMSKVDEEGARGVVHLKCDGIGEKACLVMSHIALFCEQHVKFEAEATPIERINAWNQEFITFDDISPAKRDDTLFHIILCANYLDIKSLLDLACKTVADHIKNCKSPQEIRRRFNIKNDFTPEEEEEVRKENAWGDPFGGGSQDPGAGAAATGH